MVGGKVIETIEMDETVWVNCQSKTSDQTCAIWVEKTPKSRSISEGDSLWWQSGSAYWTPQSDTSQHDIELKKVGFSHSNRPDPNSGGPSLPKKPKPNGVYLWIGSHGVIEWIVGYRFRDGFYVGKCYHTGNHWLKDLLSKITNPDGHIKLKNHL